MKAAIQDAPGRVARAHTALGLFQEHYSIDRAVDQFAALYEQMSVS